MERYYISGKARYEKKDVGLLGEKQTFGLVVFRVVKEEDLRRRCRNKESP